MTKLSVGDVVILRDGRRSLITKCDFLDGPLAPIILGIDSQGTANEIFEQDIEEIIFHDKGFVDLLTRLEKL